MGFKKMDRCLDFADFVLSGSLEANRSAQLMEKISASINCSCVEDVLIQHYSVGTMQKKRQAYPLILLFKCLLLQKWFRIPSDPELENQINNKPIKIVYANKGYAGLPNRNFLSNNKIADDIM